MSTSGRNAFCHPRQGTPCECDARHHLTVSPSQSTQPLFRSLSGAHMELAHSEEHTHGCSGGEKGGGENGDGENGGGGACHSSGVDINQAKGHLFLVNIVNFSDELFFWIKFWKQI